MVNRFFISGLVISLLFISCDNKDKKVNEISGDTLMKEVGVLETDTVAIQESTPISREFAVEKIPVKKITPLMYDTLECIFFKNKEDYEKANIRVLNNVVYLRTYDYLYLHIDGKFQKFKYTYGKSNFSNKDYSIELKQTITNEKDLSDSDLEGAYAYDANLFIKITRLEDKHIQKIELYGGCFGH
ncbi:hypothetical protein PG637_05810 [Riemerella anatipestifer]|nr:hypothetical protein [Riemerella anatipestifer]MDY3325187.1 hypothetical protein [Riemerella anatipestifer]MDY3352823.1 hypothetical protein [Riemerella anatipestifer]